MLKKRSAKNIIILFSAILLAMILIPIPRTIDKSMVCTVLDQENPDSRSHVTMKLQGTYTDYLFLRDHFQGRIYLPDHDLYDGSNPIFSIDIGSFHHINLMFMDSVNYPHYPGSFYASEDMETCFLWLMVPNEQDPSRSSSRYFITYPDLSFDQLYQIINEK